MSLSIGRLERHVTEFARSLLLNFDLDTCVDTFRSGSGGQWGPSHVELEAANHETEQVDSIVFTANGFGDWPYGQNATWGQMKAAAILQFTNAGVLSKAESAMCDECSDPPEEDGLCQEHWNDVHGQFGVGA